MVYAKTTDHQQLFILKRRGNVEETAKEDCNGFTVNNHFYLKEFEENNL